MTPPEPPSEPEPAPEPGSAPEPEPAPWPEPESAPRPGPATPEAARARPAAPAGLARLDQARAEVAAAALELLTSGLVRGTAGNVSARPGGGDLVAITPTGVDYRRLDPAGVTAVDLDGRVLAGLAPSSELPLHLAVYRARPDVRAIVHTHSTFATTLAVLGRDLPGVHYQLAHAGRRVRVAPYATYGSEALADGCVATLGADNAVLLANHGVVAVGATVAAAMTVAAAVEYTAELYWRASCLGTPVVLPDDELDRVAEAFRGYGQPSGWSAGGSPPDGSPPDGSPPGGPPPGGPKPRGHGQA